MKYIIRLIGTLMTGCTANVEVEASSQQEAEDAVWAMAQSREGVEYESAGKVWPQWDEVELAEGPEDELSDSPPADTPTALD